jgi:3-oxoacyl-[acyl-carrier protein] reductase
MTKKVALITGGAKGIGRAIALDLAAQQWSVAICYRTSNAAADETSAAITALGGQALAVQCDVSDPQAAGDLVSRVESRWGRIDALINGAGPYHRVNLFDETPAGWREMFEGNLHPIFYLGQAVAPGMKARKQGRIINFSMANADQMVAQPEVTGHYIAKAGVLILTRTLAKLLAPLRHYRQRHLSGFYRFRQRAAGGIGRCGQTNSRRIHRERGRYGRGRAILAQRGGALRQRRQSAPQRRMGHLMRRTLTWPRREWLR